MKIVVTGTRGFPEVQGGVERHCESLYESLASMGCDITVFTRKPYTRPKDYRHGGVDLIPVNCTRNKHFEAIIHTCMCVIKARKMVFDVLHIHAIGPSVCVPLARVLGMKVVMTHHGENYRHLKWSLPAKLFLKLCEAIGVYSSNGIIAISEAIATSMRKKFGRGATVIPNGVTMPEILSTRDALLKYGLEKDKYVLTVGRLVPEKGIDVLIKAFARAAIKGWKLVVVGEADHESRYSVALKAMAEGDDDIVFTGFLAGRPLRELYSHAGIFVLPSYYEGLSIAMLEAMSYGLPCIASDIMGNRPFALGDDRYFRQGDSEGLAVKMSNLASCLPREEEKRKQRDVIAGKYDWSSIAERTLEVYKEIVGEC